MEVERYENTPPAATTTPFVATGIGYSYIALFSISTDIRDRAAMCYRGPARTPLASAPAPSASDAASGPEASWRSRESKRAVVIWRLVGASKSAAMASACRRHGGLTAKGKHEGKGARAGFKHDPTHLAVLAACTQASLANS